MTTYKNLREFIDLLDKQEKLKRIQHSIDPHLEITEVCDRTLRQQGPALLFENPGNYNIPLLGNLFGSTDRIALAMGCDTLAQTREIGELLAFLRQPEAPHNFREALGSLPIFKKIMQMAPKEVKKAACQQIVFEKNQVDLGSLPIQTCWPEDVAPLITWGLVVTKGPRKKRQNMAIYRQQVLDKNKVIMRWLRHRGGALDYQDWLSKHPNEPFPIVVALGADPATILAAVTPIPDTLSEYSFAGLLRGSKTELVTCHTHDLQVPAESEIVLEGFIYPNETHEEGPFGDHTGYYNEKEHFPVFTIEKMTMRESPIYHSTYTGRPPDEPAVLGVALNELFIPILQKQFPEIVDFYLPPEGCSYRVGIAKIKKQYPGHAKQIMMGIWSFLKQFMYTKFIIVVDEDIDIRNWEDVIWAISTRVDPERDSFFVNNSPIDYLDFASPVSSIGSKMGIDATNKLPGETNRDWGKSIKMDNEVKDKIDSIWSELGI